MFDQLLINNPVFTKPIDEKIFYQWNDDLVSNFDSLGYELTPLEVLYAKANGVIDQGFSKVLGHNAISILWMTQSPYKNINIDHSFLSVRCGFAGKAREQLLDWINIIPSQSLFKLSRIRPKIGADLSLQYLDQENEEYFELLHLEKDCYPENKDKFWDWVRGVESLMQHVNWQQQISMARDIHASMKQWNITADSISDKLADSFGFDCTYDTLKPIL